MHRYAIAFHRNKRSKHQIHSELDNIKGIGPKAREGLMAAFKSVKRMKEADETRLAEVVGAAKARLLKAHWTSPEVTE